MTKEQKQKLARLTIDIAVKAHQIRYEWMPPDPRQDGKALRPWNTESTKHQTNRTNRSTNRSTNS